MTEEDTDIIPTLEDIVVAGDLDKAVTGDIDVKHLDSVESFDALFEAQTQAFDQNEDKAEETASKEQTAHEQKPETAFLTNEASHIDFWESSDFNKDHDLNKVIDPDNEFAFKTETTETDTVNDDSYLPDQQEPEAENTLFNPEQYMSDELMADALMAESLLNNNSSGDDNEIEPQNLADHTDINQLAETIVLEIMPAIESQIHSLVLSSLEKHLDQSISRPAIGSITEKDQDQ